MTKVKEKFNAENWLGTVAEIEYGNGEISLLDEKFTYTQDGDTMKVTSEHGESYTVQKIDSEWIATAEYYPIERTNKNPFIAFGQLYSNL